MPKLLRALRGATTVALDTPEEVRTATQELVLAMIEQNTLDHDDLVSIIFTCTGDVSSLFPATAARELGLGEVALLGAREVDVQGALPLCIRALIHCYSDKSRDELQHVYLRGAKVLRRDLDT